MHRNDDTFQSYRDNFVRLVRSIRAIDDRYVNIANTSLCVAPIDMFRPKFKEFVQALEAFDQKWGAQEIKRWDGDAIARYIDSLVTLLSAIVDMYEANEGYNFQTSWIAKLYEMDAIADDLVLRRLFQRYASAKSNEYESKFRSLVTKLGHSDAKWSTTMAEEGLMIAMAPRAEIAGEVIQLPAKNFVLNGHCVVTIHSQCVWLKNLSKEIGRAYAYMLETVKEAKKRFARDRAEDVRKEVIDSKRILKPIPRGQQLSMRLQLLEKLKAQFSPAELAILVHNPLRPDELPALLQS